MAVKIYTKFGDQGHTVLVGGEKVPKDHLRVRAYGGLDELNALIGFALSQSELPKELAKSFQRIQAELFQLGSELATPRGVKVPCAVLEPSCVTALEKEIDTMEGELAPLKNFILPGGSLVGGLLHFARTVCRRMERDVVLLHRAEPLRAVVIQYVNRLSDFLFVSARFANHRNGKKEVSWVAPSSS